MMSMFLANSISSSSSFLPRMLWKFTISKRNWSAYSLESDSYPG